MDPDQAYLMINANLNWAQAFHKKIPKFSKMKRKTSFFLVEKAIFLFSLIWTQLWATKPQGIFGFPEEHLTSQTKL
jgi:hypothetical protein